MLSLGAGGQGVRNCVTWENFECIQLTTCLVIIDHYAFYPQTHPPFFFPAVTLVSPINCCVLWKSQRWQTNNCFAQNRDLLQLIERDRRLRLINQHLEEMKVQQAGSLHASPEKPAEHSTYPSVSDSRSQLNEIDSPFHCRRDPVTQKTRHRPEAFPLTVFCVHSIIIN